MPERESADVIVVGAGLEGLLLATELARGGLSVIVMERRTEVGGRCRADREGGFTFPRSIRLARYGTYGSLGEILFRQGDATALLELGKSYALYPGGVTALPLGLRFAYPTRLVGPRDQFRIARLILRLRWAADAASVEDLDEWMAAERIGGRLAELLRLVAGTMTMRADPGRLAAREVLEALRRSLDLGISMAYPAEGWAALVRCALDRLRSHGGVLRTECRADRIRVARGRVLGVVSAAGELLEGSKVVWTADPRGLHAAAEELDPALDRAIGTVRPVAATSLALGLSEAVSTTTGLWRIDSPTSWAFFASNIAGSLAPKGKQLLLACAPMAAGSATVGSTAEALESRLCEVFPGLAGRIEHRRFWAVDRLHGSDVGANATRSHRPPVRAAAPRGLFVVGDACAAAGLGPDIGFSSVRRCVHIILGNRASLPPPEVDVATEAGSAVKRRHKRRIRAEH